MLFMAVLGDLDWKVFFVAQAVIFVKKNSRIHFEKLNQTTLQYHR